MVVTDDDELAERLRSLRNLGFRPSGGSTTTVLGFNFRLTNLQAALGVAQLERIDEIVARKREIAAAYTERLTRGLPGLTLPGEKPWARSVFWMYGIVVDGGDRARRRGPRGATERTRMETRPFFLGMHEQPALHRIGPLSGERYPVAERIARQGLYLPSGLALTDAQVETVCAR